MKDPNFLDVPSLYGITGNILDLNTLLVNRNDYKRMQPWWVRLKICLHNWRTMKKFVLHL
jgi:hypothetical protein